jgi:hypothetical protein
MSADKRMPDQSILWGHAIEWWDAWGVRAMLLGAILGFLALVVSLFSSFVLWRVAGVAQADLQTKTGRLSGEVETQKRLTAEAVARAEQARLEQEKLRAQLAWRTLTKDQAEALVTRLSTAPGILTLMFSEDPETQFLASQLSQIFTKAKWKVHAEKHIHQYVLFTGVHILNPTGNKKVTMVAEALAAAGLPCTMTQEPPYVGAYVGPAPFAGPTDVALLIGSKQPQL